ncbi:MAG: GNAT family N-acetyltransferase [Pirellulales bacterium]|nr:GNAT family N-acetyltransferase [Pirellulales bacterium]
MRTPRLRRRTPGLRWRCAQHLLEPRQDQFVYVRCIENLAEVAPYQQAWDALAGDCVFRSYSWLTTWWRHYGQAHHQRRLAILLAFSQQSGGDRLVAVLPAYVDPSWRQGRVLRLMGDGEVCSDHAGALVTQSSDLTTGAIGAFAAHLIQRDDWDLIDFTAVDDDDAASAAIFQALALHECTVSRLLADRCWAIELPPTWEEYLGQLSKSHRKQLRQLERRVLDAGLGRWQLVQSSREFADAWTTLVDLHQRRRQSLNQPGCFASPTWAAFHWDVAQQLLAAGRLRLSTLQLGGAAIAAEYHLAGGRVTFAYQGGVEPRRLADEPGQLSTLCSLQHAIAEGHARFDLLRGDEPYKAHWRAAPRQAVRLLAIPPRLWPRVRHGAWSGARRLAGAARQYTGLFS